MVVDVKEAVKKASNYLVGFVPSAAGQMLIEEIEQDETNKFWLVTLSYPDPENPMFSASRKYKIVKVRRSDGEVISMKIRTIK